MRPFFILPCLIGLSLFIFAQNRDCRSLQEGTFRITTQETGTTVIKRTNKTQIEENIEFGVKMIFDLKWIDDCTYELRAKEIIKGDPALMGKKGDVVTVRIKEIKTNSYIAESSANFTDAILIREIEILH